MSWLAHRVQSLAGIGASESARTWQARTGDGLWLGAEDRRQILAQYESTPAPGILTLGSFADVPGDPVWLGLPVSEFSALHGQIQGASGGGKSVLAISILATLIQSGQPVIVVDLKHETAEFLLDVLLPALVQSPEGEAIARTVRVIRPFDQRWVAPLRITTPEEGVAREVQALSILTSLEEASREPFPAKMTRCSLVRLLLAIERNDPLGVLIDWLTNPGEFARAAQQSTDPSVREYVRSELSREPTSSLSAVITRLQNFLFLPDVRAALSAPGCVSFPDMFNSGLTIVDLGAPPAGQERAAKFWAVLLLGRLVRAALNRPVAATTPRATLLADEVQEALSPDVAAMLQRMVSLARYRKVQLITVNQASAQMSSVAPELMSALRTSSGFSASFRSNPEDARALAPGLASGVTRGDQAQALTRMTQALTRLRNREYVLWLRQSGLPAMKLRSPFVDIDDLKRRAGRCPAELRDAIQRGAVAVDRSALVKPNLHQLSILNECSDSAEVVAFPTFPKLG